ncbi:hypothetical protein QR98_0100920, partial [Sarcoptes scabiei]
VSCFLKFDHATREISFGKENFLVPIDFKTVRINYFFTTNRPNKALVNLCFDVCDLFRFHFGHSHHKTQVQ